MFKKAILTTSFLLFVGMMITGAIHRTEARLTLVSSAAGEGRGQDEDLAEPPVWQQMEGVVMHSNAQTLSIAIPNRDPILVHGRGLSFALEMGFAPAPGDPIQIEGFEEHGEFKVARMTNLAHGQVVQLYDDQGRPAWSGRANRAEH
jgi:hypothetical protein